MTRLHTQADQGLPSNQIRGVIATHTTETLHSMEVVRAVMAKLEVDDTIFEGLDRFIQDRDRPPRGHLSRDEAISVIARDWLMSQGYIPLPGDPDAITPALDAAEVPKD